MRYWGKRGAFWIGLWGLLFGSTSFLVPGTGIPKDSVLKYGISLKANKFLLVVHGTADEVERASSILQGTDAIEMTVHAVETLATTTPWDRISARPWAP